MVCELALPAPSLQLLGVACSVCSPGKHLPFPGRVRCQTPGTAAGKVAVVPYAQVAPRTVGKGDLQVESYDRG